MITEELLKQFKERMHISHNSEDDNLKRLLSFSYVYVSSRCGEFSLVGDSHIDRRGQELVLERARYAYNDALEFFEDNFLSAITALGIDIAHQGDGEGDDDEEI